MFALVMLFLCLKADSWRTRRFPVEQPSLRGPVGLVRTVPAVILVLAGSPHPPEGSAPLGWERPPFYDTSGRPGTYGTDVPDVGTGM